MVRQNRSVLKYSVPLNKSKQDPNGIHNIAFKQKEKAKKKFELKSKKEKIVIENLKKKKKNCNNASSPNNTLRKIPEAATA